VLIEAAAAAAAGKILLALLFTT